MALARRSPSSPPPRTNRHRWNDFTSAASFFFLGAKQQQQQQQLQQQHPFGVLLSSDVPSCQWTVKFVRLLFFVVVVVVVVVMVSGFFLLGVAPGCGLDWSGFYWVGRWRGNQRPVQSRNGVRPVRQWRQWRRRRRHISYPSAAVRWRRRCWWALGRRRLDGTSYVTHQRALALSLSLSLSLSLFLYASISFHSLPVTLGSLCWPGSHRAPFSFHLQKRLLPSCTDSDRILPIFTEFYLVLPNFTHFEPVFPSSTGFLPSFT